MIVWLPAIAQMAVIFAASSIPDLGPMPGGISDKSGHSIGYAILGALLLRALARARWPGVTWKTVLLAIVIATVYAVSDELHQWFVPGRSPDVLDVVADMTGAAIAVAIIGAAAAGRAWGILKSSSPPGDGDRRGL